MVYYILLLIITFCFFGLKKSANTNQRDLCLKIVCLVLSLVMGFRGLNVGVDTASYADLFNQISRLSFMSIISFKYQNVVSQEFGFVLSAKVSSMIIDSYYFYQILTAFVFNFLFIKFLKDNASSLVVAITAFIGLGVYLAAFNISRQMLAIAILANAWTYMRKGSYIKTFILFILAVSFHKTSLLFGGAFIMYYFRNYKYVYYVFAAVIGFAALKVERTLEYLVLVAPDEYFNYLDNHKVVQTAGSVVLLWGLIVIIGMLLIVKKKIQPEIKIVALLSLLYPFGNFLGLSFNYVERLALYFCPFVILSFDASVALFSRNLRKPYVICTVIAFYIYFILSCSTKQYQYSLF